MMTGTGLLQRLMSFAQWKGRSSGRSAGSDVATGRGVTYVKYELSRTYVGAVADVEVNRKSGEIRVKHVAIVQDCGQIINPDGRQEPDRGQRRPDREPRAEGRGHLRSLSGDQPGLGQLFHPDLP